MRYISVFSGIEAASVAWNPLGWEAVAFSEIEPFPCALLEHYYPDVPNLGDISKVDWSVYYGTVDLVVGGSPCQSFSIAGQREGMDGASGLVREYFRLLAEVKPTWFVWENVPGVFSTKDGVEFKYILQQWDDVGYHVAWSVIDAERFSPMRRKRVFVIGHSGNWRYPAKVLFGRQQVYSILHRQKTQRDRFPCFTSSSGGPSLERLSQVLFSKGRFRKFTPLEIERCFGFPDHYTDIEFKGKPAPDGVRYKALGNSMCVNVMRWIGERIQAVEDGKL